ncbi:MAG: histidine phosphatase family protein [Actinomycetota bacterium]
MTERTLYLIRHGRADYDSDDFVRTPRGYQYDPPLSDEGREQAAILARRLLLLEPPAAVVSSPLRRARETAIAYAEPAGIEPSDDMDLAEAFIGGWENRSFEQIIETNETMLAKYRNHDAFWRHAPAAEDLDAFRERVTRGIERVLVEHPDGNVYVFCHGGVVNAYAARLLGLEQEMFFLPENTSLNVLSVDGDRRVVRFLNDARHLTEPHMFADAPGPAA